MQKFLLLFLMVFALRANEATAQKRAKRYDAIVRTENGYRYKGLLESVDDNGLIVRFHRKSTLIPADAIQTIRIKRYNAQNRNFLTGSLLGLGAGLAVYKIEEGKGNVGPIILPVVIISSLFTGAALFGTINSITSVEKFENVSDKFAEIKDKLSGYSQDQEGLLGSSE